MRKVTLTEGIESSALGFGCAPILGSVGAGKARRALDCAFDCGVNHFDLARSYGYGEAEAFVGNVLKGRRDEVVLASKFGIRANWKAKALRPVKPLVRYFRSKRGAAAPTEAAHPAEAQASLPDRFHDRVAITGPELRKSLEASLKALQTDYLDYLFVHEPPGTIADFEQLAETVEMLKKEGKVRAWGLAFMQSQSHLHANYLHRFDILQFNVPRDAQKYPATVRERGGEPNILFSPFGKSSQKVPPADQLASLFTDFPKSVVLCSMFSEQHIRSNSAVASGNHI